MEGFYIFNTNKKILLPLPLNQLHKKRMSFSEIIAVSKLTGLYKMHKQRADGLILKSLQDDKVFFASSRAHNFTPLDNITIYTHDEPIELLDIMLKMKEQKTSIPNPKEDGQVLKSFFSKIVPNYDEDRVYTSDIQKIIKWYLVLENSDLIQPRTTHDKSEETNTIDTPVESQSELTDTTPEKKPKTSRKKKTEE